MANSRKDQTRNAWLEMLAKYKFDAEAPATDQIWSPSLECASRD